MFASVRNWASRALKSRRYLAVLTAEPTTPTQTSNSPVRRRSICVSSLADGGCSETMAGIHLAYSGFRTAKDAHMIATLSSTLDKTTAYVPDPIKGKLRLGDGMEAY